MRSRWKKIFFLWLAGLSLTLVPKWVFAEEDPGTASQKKLDFEGDLVEGVNKKPLDSLSQISDQDEGKKRIHLYQRKEDLKPELKENLRGLAETY